MVEKHCIQFCQIVLFSSRYLPWKRRFWPLSTSNQIKTADLPAAVNIKSRARYTNINTVRFARVDETRVAFAPLEFAPIEFCPRNRGERIARFLLE